MNTINLGNYRELQCISKFISLGYTCSIPYGNSAKYDFIAELDGKLIRIQCKSPTLNYDSLGNLMGIFIKTYTSTLNTKGKVRFYTYTKKDIDYISTFYEGQIYLIPIDVINENSKSIGIRFNSPRNSVKDYKYASDFEIEKVLGVDKQEVVFSDNQHPKGHCVSCGKPLRDKFSTLCSECAHLASRKVIRPERDLFKKLIRTEIFTSIANQFGVSDKSISNWCKSYNLPSKKSDINQISDKDWEIL